MNIVLSEPFGIRMLSVISNKKKTKTIQRSSYNKVILQLTYVREVRNRGGLQL